MPACSRAPPIPASLLEGAHRVIILENVADPTNVGAIFRPVAATGTDAVFVIPRCSDPLYRRVIRIPGSGPGSEPEGGEPAGFVAPEHLALVLGAEREGLMPEALAAADAILQIPMSHRIDSLNVAATAAVAMWALAG